MPEDFPLTTGELIDSLRLLHRRMQTDPSLCYQLSVLPYDEPSNTRAHFRGTDDEFKFLFHVLEMIEENVETNRKLKDELEEEKKKNWELRGFKSPVHSLIEELNKPSLLPQQANTCNLFGRVGRLENELAEKKQQLDKAISNSILAQSMAKSETICMEKQFERAIQKCLKLEMENLELKEKLKFMERPPGYLMDRLVDAVKEDVGRRRREREEEWKKTVEEKDKKIQELEDHIKSVKSQNEEIEKLRAQLAEMEVGRRRKIPRQTTPETDGATSSGSEDSDGWSRLDDDEDCGSL